MEIEGLLIKASGQSAVDLEYFFFFFSFQRVSHHSELVGGGYRPNEPNQHKTGVFLCKFENK